MNDTKEKPQRHLLDEYNSRKSVMLQVMDNDGKVIHPEVMPDLSDDAVVDAYKRMLYARTADQMAISYQRQGRMYTYPPNFGQEAIGVAVGMVMKPDDWLVPAYRELSALLAKGAEMKDIFLYFAGFEDGSIYPNGKNILPPSVPIASQLLHAVGIGYALKVQKKNDVVFTFVGDGGTSEGDFHEALNFAGVWKAPVIFVVQNNQYAISQPRSNQTAADSLAIKSVAYGIQGIQVDGNDLFAVYAAVLAADEHAVKGKGPVLIEAVTYRRGAHTTSDDPKRYRSDEEELMWAEKDPQKRLKSYLISRKLWKQEDDEPLIAQYKKEIDLQFSEVEKYPFELVEIFKYQYADMPDDLKQQMIAYEKFLNWKESLQ